MGEYPDGCFLVGFKKTPWSLFPIYKPATTKRGRQGIFITSEFMDNAMWYIEQKIAALR
jgi:hypothetical protein